MTDLFHGQTMTEAYKFISGGAEHTFQFNFDADKAIFYNLTDWTATAGNLPISVWFKGQTTAAHAYQQAVIDTNAGSSFNFLDTATNGFTPANTSGGVTEFREAISGITQADPCVVTTSTTHGFQTNQLVRITDLGPDMPTARGMDQLNNLRFRIVVIDTTSFSLKDPISDEAINSTAFTAYVSGGSVVLETRVIRPNNPLATPYTENPYTYDPIEYRLTVGTSVMGTDGDIFRIEVIKYGQFYDLGDIG
jgi:hypothetical protein